MDKHFELINFPNHYAIGEMINFVSKNVYDTPRAVLVWDTL